MRAEGDIAIMTRMRWQDRGPEELLRQRAIRDANPHLFAADTSELPATWRGQPLRVNSLKYAKRGGKKAQKKKLAKRQRAMPNVGYTPLYKGNDDDENGDGDAGRLGGDWLLA